MQHEAWKVVLFGMFENVKCVTCDFTYVSSWEIGFLPGVDKFVKYGFQAVG